MCLTKHAHKLNSYCSFVIAASRELAKSTSDKKLWGIRSNPDNIYGTGPGVPVETLNPDHLKASKF